MQLWRFPVKSLGGEQLERADVDGHGIAGDRQWAIVDGDTGLVLTARRCPDLLFGRAALSPSGAVAITVDGGAELQDDADLSDWLGRPVRLVRAGIGTRGRFEAPVDFEQEATSLWVTCEGPEGSFHDSARTQLSVLSLDAIGPWDVRRFRANVVIDVGADSLLGGRIRVGTVTADVVKQIDRCVVTTRPQPGLPRDLDVLRTINRHRASYLGVGALVVHSGGIEVGDRVSPVPR